MSKWEKVGVCNVDSGTIHIGDPCYILPDDRFDDEPKMLYNEYLSEEDLSPPYIEMDKSIYLEEDPIKQIKAFADAKEREYKLAKEWYKTSGIKQLNHEVGHPGLGVAIFHFGGDGTYPVFVRRDEQGTILEAKVVFDGSEE